MVIVSTPLEEGFDRLAALEKFRSIPPIRIRIRLSDDLEIAAVPRVFRRLDLGAGGFEREGVRNSRGDRCDAI